MLGRTKKKIDIYELEKNSRKTYSQIKLTNFFPNDKQPKKLEGLRFGFICPGAINTMKYLNKLDKNKGVVRKIKLLTDFQFYVEILTIYKKYLSKDIYKKHNSNLPRNKCQISKKITLEITNLFNSLPDNIKNNLPDDFYHVRHNTLICSKDKGLAEERIKLIKSKFIEKFTNTSTSTSTSTSKCLGKRDGVSGCRDCCSQFSNKKYKKCVSDCMNF